MASTARMAARGAFALDAGPRAGAAAGIPDAAVRTADADRASRGAAALAAAAGAPVATEADAVRQACRASSVAVAAEMADELVPPDQVVPPRALPDGLQRLARPDALWRLPPRDARTQTPALAVRPPAPVEVRPRAAALPADASLARADAPAAASGLVARCGAATWVVRTSRVAIGVAAAPSASRAPLPTVLLRQGRQRRARAPALRQAAARRRPVVSRPLLQRAPAPRQAAPRRRVAAPARVPPVPVALRPAQEVVRAVEPRSQRAARGFPLAAPPVRVAPVLPACAS